MWEGNRKGVAEGMTHIGMGRLGREQHQPCWRTETAGTGEGPANSQEVQRVSFFPSQERMGLLWKMVEEKGEGKAFP